MFVLLAKAHALRARGLARRHVRLSPVRGTLAAPLLGEALRPVRRGIARGDDFVTRRRP
jgi:hypothetical protein